MSESTKKRSPLVMAAIALGVLVLACALFYATGLNRAVLGLLPPMEGQEAAIRVNGPSAIVAVDIASYRAAGQVSTAELQQMQVSGTVFLVPNGTRVLVLEVTAQYSRIQVLSGEHTGKAGLVPPAFVQW